MKTWTRVVLLNLALAGAGFRASGSGKITPCLATGRLSMVRIICPRNQGAVQSESKVSYRPTRVGRASRRACSLQGSAQPQDRSSTRCGQYVQDQAHTNGIESFWALLKRGYYGTYHRMSPKHLQRYVYEFAGRHNTRSMDTTEQIAGCGAGHGPEAVAVQGSGGVGGANPCGLWNGNCRERLRISGGT